MKTILNIRCVVCGANGECNCWVKLICPKCKRTKTAQRVPSDYPETATIEVVCPKCDNGDFCEPMHFDKSGRHITRDPEKG